jgi:hypothetical protein
MSKKSDALVIVQDWKARVETESGKKVKIFRSDHGAEYDSGAFERMLADDGMPTTKTESLSVPFEPSSTLSAPGFLPPASPLG